MSNKLVILLNGESQVEFHRDKPLSDKQLQYLDKMDRDMNSGIALGGARIVQPDKLERAQFVTITLIQAVRDGNETIAAAMLSYLADRYPDLRQVKTVQEGDEFSVDLVFDQDYIKTEPIKFMKPGGGSSLH